MTGALKIDTTGAKEQKFLKRISCTLVKWRSICTRNRFEKDVRTLLKSWIAGGKYHKHRITVRWNFLKQLQDWRPNSTRKCDKRAKRQAFAKKLVMLSLVKLHNKKRRPLHGVDVFYQDFNHLKRYSVWRYLLNHHSLMILLRLNPLFLLILVAFLPSLPTLGQLTVAFVPEIDIRFRKGTSFFLDPAY